MLTRMLKIGAYAKAPVQTFVMLHPKRAMKWGASYLVVKTALGARRSKKS